ncbi:MAG: shikimate kinase [Eubacteriales bacterium]|nr:shikimate kinase [Eubacteriales bacterium]
MDKILLIGMPSCGKTSIGTCLAKILHYTFIDTDRLIEERAGITIAEIFEASGEAAFRQLETACMQSCADETDAVISAGGGVILRPENMAPYADDATMVVWIRRDMAGLQVGGARPLSTSRAALAEMYEKRRPLYERYADEIVDNIGVSETARHIAAMVRARMQDR